MLIATYVCNCTVDQTAKDEHETLLCRCGAAPPGLVAMPQASSGMHVTASSAAPILAVSQTSARSKSAAKTERLVTT